MDWSGITASILGAHGDAATWAHHTGGSASVRAVIADSVDVVDEDGQIIERVRAATVQKSLLLTSPSVGDTLTVGTKTWVVQRLLSDDGAAVQVALS